MRISDWISDVCSSDLIGKACHLASKRFLASSRRFSQDLLGCHLIFEEHRLVVHHGLFATVQGDVVDGKTNPVPVREHVRSEERRVGNVCVSTGSTWWSPFH